MSYNGSQFSMEKSKGEYPVDVYFVHFSYKKDGEFLQNRGYIRPYFSLKAAKYAANWHRNTYTRKDAWGRSPTWGSIEPAARIFGIEGVADEVDW